MTEIRTSLVVSFLCTGHVWVIRTYLLCMTRFPLHLPLQQHQCTGLSYSAPSLPCLCTQRSPQRLLDKCALIHSTCSAGLYIDPLILPWPRCNMNSTPHQFKYVMSPAWTPGSSAYHIYDMLPSIAGARRKCGE